MSLVGIIAGKGKLPVLLAEEVKNAGDLPLIIALDNENKDVFALYAEDKVFPFSITQVSKIIRCLKKHEIKNLIFAGKVEKALTFQNLSFDLTAMKLLSRLKNRSDEGIMLEIINFLEKEEGFHVLNQTDYLQKYLIQKGYYCGKKLNKEEMENVEFGFEKAKAIAELDIGQTVVVNQKAVIAVEAIEGTDAAIQRAAKLVQKGCVVVKVAKKNQDLRFDIPAIGTKTLENMSVGKMRILAVEAGKTFSTEPEKLKAEAEKYSITIIAL